MSAVYNTVFKIASCEKIEENIKVSKIFHLRISELHFFPLKMAAIELSCSLERQFTACLFAKTMRAMRT